MKKLFSIIIASVFCVLAISTSVSAESNWKDEFHKTFEGTPLQEADTKLKDFITKAKSDETKQKAIEKWNSAKDWVDYKWNNYGKHTFPAEGFEFYTDSSLKEKYDQKVFFTVKVGAIRDSLYFSNEKGEKISQLVWVDLATGSSTKYRFVQIAANGKLKTNIIQRDDVEYFPNKSYYVWAELELKDGRKLLRPVPVSKKTFKQLKKAKKGTEFEPNFEK